MKSPKEIEASVSRFLGHFSSKLDEIKETEFGGSGNLFRKTLYVGVIDALAKTTASPKKGNRERLVSFIDNYSDWNNHERVSLPHLARVLELAPDPEFSRLREYTFEEMDKWSSGELIKLHRDAKFQEVKSLWPKSSPKPIEDVNLEFLQHTNLFYRYRNSLVHELREPGYGVELDKDDEPYYHSMHTDDEESYSWELVYPCDFYEKICRSSINNLREYYIKERIDPYNCHNFGSYWIEVLNK